MNHVRLLISAFVLFAGTAVAGADEFSAPPFEQRLTVTLDPAGHRLRATSTIAFPGGRGGREVLLLNPRAEIEAVTRNDVAIPYDFTSGVVAFDLPPSSVGTMNRIDIRYGCVFNDPLPTRFLDSEEPTYGIAGTILPQGTFLSADAGWYPRSAAPPERLIVTVIAPAGTEAVTAGRRVRRGSSGGTSVSQWEIREPLPAVSLSAGPYRVRERSVDGIPVYTYFYGEDDPISDRYLAAAAKYLRGYRKLFGPYPFAKFAVVENFFPTGYGFPSYTLIGASVLRLPFIIDTSLPHEIAHNWWGNGVMVSDGGGNWSEGLVTYLADYRQEAGGSEAKGADYRYRLLVEYASVVPPDRDFPLRSFRSRTDPVSHAIGYGKGAMLFHMVNARIGDAAFYAGLSRVLAEKLFKQADWGDFARAFSSVSGTDMVAFMAPWLDRPGGPRLALEGVARQQQGGRWSVSGTVAQRTPLYTLPLTLRVETASGRRDSVIDVAGERTSFLLNVASAPKRLLLDPDFHVFRLLDRREIPMSVNRIKGSESLRVVMTQGCRADVETLRQLLVSLGKRDVAVYREEEPGQDSLASHDILYCGMPAVGTLPPLPDGVILAPGAFTIGRQRYEEPDDALFVVLRDPAFADRAIALFLPLSREAAASSMPKVTHYGKFGYLVFTAGKNRAKGYFPPAQGMEVKRF
jgi:aminopeptidase N